MGGPPAPSECVCIQRMVPCLPHEVSLPPNLVPPMGRALCLCCGERGKCKWGSYPSRPAAGHKATREDQTSLRQSNLAHQDVAEAAMEVSAES